MKWIFSLSMHFIRGWPWQPSWSRVVSGVSMSRRSSNKVEEQRSSSSNTTAPIDTPLGNSYTLTHKGHNHAKYCFLLLCLPIQQPPDKKTEPGCSQDPEIPAPMPPQVSPYLLTHSSTPLLSAHIQTCTYWRPTAVHALSALVLIVVLLFLWSPLMDARPLKRVSFHTFFLLSLPPGGWCLFACQQSEGERRSWIIILPFCSLSLSLSLPSCLPISQSLSLFVSVSLQWLLNDVSTQQISES